EALDPNTLSEKFHFSVSSICHIFKEDFGISIKKCILQKRINAAHMALQRGERPEAVCAAYGFSNYSTFYRAYKNHVGVPPSKYVPHK
ncbi:MAG: helix-turn-helix transcriptional regulator, partial [Lachnospiraceae bacterium]|nr:helix-turn-helix transcriptional regulator [Lachnospiraceae bacterium]